MPMANDTVKNPVTFYDWNNDNNADFYLRSFDQAVHQELVQAGGLANYCDLKLIYNDVIKANTILEVGAGYGRVIEFLVKQKIPAHIYAIERCKQYCDMLEKKYGHKITIFNEDILKFTTKDPFDLILWLWSGISDFNPDEQLKVIKNLVNYLSENGILILETLYCGEKPKNSDISEGYYYTKAINNSVIHGYIPSSEKISNYKDQLGFRMLKQLHYLTSTNRPRILYWLSK